MSSSQVLFRTNKSFEIYTKHLFAPFQRSGFFFFFSLFWEYWFLHDLIVHELNIDHLLLSFLYIRQHLQVFWSQPKNFEIVPTKHLQIIKFLYVSQVYLFIYFNKKTSTSVVERTTWGQLLDFTIWKIISLQAYIIGIYIHTHMRIYIYVCVDIYIYMFVCIHDQILLHMIAHKAVFNK